MKMAKATPDDLEAVGIHQRPRLLESKPIRVGDLIQAGTTMTYFHGGPPGRQRGTFLLPPNITKVRSLSEFGAAAVHRRDRVYVTTAFEAALIYAASARNGVIYHVEPLGQIEADPDCDMPGLSWQCEKARVLRIIKPTSQMIDMAQSVLLGTIS